MERLVVLDTETTGLNRKKENSINHGHRIIEIGCVEIVNNKITGRKYHTLLQPDMKVDEKATKIHGINDRKLRNAPRFEDIAEKFLNFIKDATIIIHNAPFDISFLDKEMERLPRERQPQGELRYIDTLEKARVEFPGHRNDLDALSVRFGIKGREGKHGALVDSQILAEIYLKMTTN